MRTVRERIAVGVTASARLAPAGGWAVGGGAGAPGLGGGSVIGAPGQPAGRRRIRLSVVLAAAAILIAGAGLGLALTFAGSRVLHGTRHTKTHRKLAPGALVPPAVPVVILNATAVPGAAHKLSAGLSSRGVHIAGVGNVAGPRPTGLEVLYAPNQRTPARRLAALLAQRHPSIAPIDPATEAAAGAHAKLVIVIG
jgi:hypothetical protein